MTSPRQPVNLDLAATNAQSQPIRPHSRSVDSLLQSWIHLLQLQATPPQPAWMTESPAHLDAWLPPPSSASELAVAASSSSQPAQWSSSGDGLASHGSAQCAHDTSIAALHSLWTGLEANAPAAVATSSDPALSASSSVSTGSRGVHGDAVAVDTRTRSQSIRSRRNTAPGRLMYGRHLRCSCLADGRCGGTLAVAIPFQWFPPPHSVFAGSQSASQALNTRDHGGGTMRASRGSSKRRRYNVHAAAPSPLPSPSAAETLSMPSQDPPEGLSAATASTHIATPTSPSVTSAMADKPARSSASPTPRRTCAVPASDEHRMQKMIRNRLAAKEHRRRKKKYIRDMEQRVRHLSLENQALKSQLMVLEAKVKVLSRKRHSAVTVASGNPPPGTEDSGPAQDPTRQSVSTTTTTVSNDSTVTMDLEAASEVDGLVSRTASLQSDSGSSKYSTSTMREVRNEIRLLTEFYRPRSDSGGGGDRPLHGK